MNYRFIYSKSNEIQRVKNVLHDKDFFLEFGYEPMLPSGVTLNSKYSKKMEEKINEEFDEGKAKKIEELLKAELKQNKSSLEEFFKSLKINLPKEIKIELTKYDTQGSYLPPDTAIINFQYNDYFETLIHELVHSLIEGPVIDSFNLSHEEKEGVVELLLLNDKNLSKLSNFKVNKYAKKPTTELHTKVTSTIYK